VTAARPVSSKWAVVKGNDLHGMIFFHGGDESEFEAKRAGETKRMKRK
jgi:hypothetical protein